MKSLTALQLIARHDKLKSKRANFESLWQELYEYILPRKDEIITQRSPGEQLYESLLDSTAMTSNELLAGALHGMLTNPAGYFFNLSTGIPEIDGDDDVRLWLQQVVRKMHDVLNASNFQTEVHEMYLDLGCAGTACMFMEEDPTNIVRFSTKPLREIYIGEDSKGVINYVSREFKMTASDLVDEFGEENLPKPVVDAFKKGDSKEFTVINSIYSRKIARVAKKDMRFDFISQFVLKDEKVNIQVEGFNELPCMVPRWTKVSGECYGRGPGEKALPSAKTANVMRATVIQGAQKVVDPPLQAPDDGFVMPVLNTYPGGISYYRAGSQDRVEPIFNDSRIDFGFQTIDQERLQIREAFYTDQLKLREGPQMTATEVAERVEQALRFMGPMLGRQQTEFLKPLVERLYGILDRRGEIPPAPAQIPEGLELKIQYSSIMAMQQRMSEAQNIGRTMQGIAPFVSSDATVLDNIDGDAALKYMAKLYNFPQEILRKKEDVERIRQQRAEQRQAELQAMQQQMQAESASKVVGAAAKLKPAG